MKTGRVGRMGEDSGHRTLASTSIAFTLTSTSGAYEDSDQWSAKCEPELAIAREATRKYKIEAVALADGYVPVSPCEQSSRGTMGIHQIGPEYDKPGLDVTQPEFLVYVPKPTAKRLDGIEYSEGIRVNGQLYFGEKRPPDEAEPSAPPVIFGHQLDGPMAGHSEPQEWHYDLTVSPFNGPGIRVGLSNSETLQ